MLLERFHFYFVIGVVCVACGCSKPKSEAFPYDKTRFLLSGYGVDSIRLPEGKKCNHVMLILQLDGDSGRGSLYFDRSLCTLNSFGDIVAKENSHDFESCEVKVVLEDGDDPFSANRSQYRLLSPHLHYIVTLVVPNDPLQAHYLLITQDNRTKTVIPMLHIPSERRRYSTLR